MSDAGPGWPDGGGPLRREPPVGAGCEDALIVDVAGFEGPLDLLLELARGQKVDLKSGSPSWRLPSNISHSSPRRASCGSSLPPITW